VSQSIESKNKPFSTPIVKNEGLGLIFAIASAFGFSFKAIFVKLGLAHGGDVVTLLALRMGFALPIFLFMAWRAEIKDLSKRDWLNLALLGLLGYYLSSLFDFLGLQYISAGLERLILFLYPTLVVLLSAIFLGQALTRQNIIALALCYAGIGLAVGHDLHIGTDYSALAWGSAWVFASTITYALYIMGSGRVISHLGATRFTAFASIFACLFCLGHFSITRPFSALIVPMRVYIDGLCLAFISTALPIYLQARAMRELPAGKVALIGTLGPVLTIFFSWLILGEHLSVLQILGTGLVLIGVRVAGKGGQKGRS
jgi:drug/metabolite transporter (DMT)-like permease